MDGGSNRRIIHETEIKKPRQMARFLYLALDDDLLSHGETPHYHRRYVVSLLSSEWDQVVPTLYGRQAILLHCRGLPRQGQ